MTRHLILLLLSSFFLLLLTSACHTTRTTDDATDVPPLTIHRFDRALLAYIDADSTHAPALADALRSDYPELLRMLQRSLIERPDTLTLDTFLLWAADYYNEPHLHQLYLDAVGRYPDPTADSLACVLRAALARLRTDSPDLPVPAICFHVSGLYQNVLVRDSLLSLSIDKYLGTDYPLYADLLPAHARREMTPAHVVPHILEALLKSEYPFRGNDAVLLDRMIYEGAIDCLILRALPDLPLSTLFGWTPDELSRCEREEAIIWRTIVGRRALYTPDRITTERYFRTLPADFLSPGLPGHIGEWIGLRIVSRYEAKTHAPLVNILRTPDPQAVLTTSKYRPR